jgi:hypothetical protein
MIGASVLGARGALRGAFIRGFATAAAGGSTTSSSAAALLHSDLSYRALLRNLKLLGGMRGDQASFKAVITGFDAAGVAAAIAKLEPSVTFDVVESLEHLAKLPAGSADAVIVTQVRAALYWCGHWHWHRHWQHWHRHWQHWHRHWQHWHRHWQHWHRHWQHWYCLACAQ